MTDKIKLDGQTINGDTLRRIVEAYDSYFGDDEAGDINKLISLADAAALQIQELNRILNVPSIADFEPHKIRPVRSSGDIYVGREHKGKTAHIYFLRSPEA